MKILISFVLLCFVSLCSHAKEAGLVLFKSAKNPAHQLEVQYFVDSAFYKETQWSSMHPEKVVLVNHKLKEKMDYQALDHDGLKIKGAYNEQVWSPDKKYLVLPLGLFDGFVVYPAGEAWESMKNGIYPIRIKMRLDKDKPALMHEFKGWSKNNTLIFEAGLSGSNETVQYNIETGQISGTKAYDVIITKSTLVKSGG